MKEKFELIKWTAALLLLLQTVDITVSKTSTNLIEMPTDQEHEDNTAILVDNLNLTFRGDYHRATVHSHKKVVVCYVGTWATYRKPEEGSYDIKHIEPLLCTHLIYSFVGLDNQTYVMKPLDPWLDQHLQENGGGRDWFKHFNDLKIKYPHLKVLLAIGGWNEGSKKYSDMAADSRNREAFVQSALDLVRKYGFDGLDLDWEFPADRGGSPNDKRQFTILVQELRIKFDKYGLMLTAAFGPAKSTAEKAYELKELSKLLDHVHLMCYDYHGAWDNKTNHNAPLYASAGEGSVEASINYYLEQGVPRNKLVVGFPFYGRTFLLNDEGDDLDTQARGARSGLRRTAENKGFQGPFTKEDGFLGYNEICKELISSRGDWKTYWDDMAKVPYMRNGNKWVSFDNPDSFREKIKFLIKMRLRGAMIWSIDTDDFQAYCGIKNPLLRTINYALYHDQIPDDDTPSKPTSRPQPPTGSAPTIQYTPSVALFLLLSYLFIMDFTNRP